MSVPTKPGNAERGWNDPPVFLHSQKPTTAVPENSTSTKRTLLTKRVAHTGLYGGATNESTVVTDSATDGTDPGSSHGSVVLFPPTTTTEFSKYTAPIIVPSMSPVEKDPPTATNPITNTQINVDDAENSLGMPNFDSDEQMFHYVLAKLQKTLIDVQGTLQPRVIEDVKKKLDLLSSMWRSGALSYSVKSSMTRLATVLHHRKCDEAHHIHMSLMMDSVSEVGHWMVGVKRLIQEARSTQAPVSSTSTTAQPEECGDADSVTLLNFNQSVPFLQTSAIANSVDSDVTPSMIAGSKQSEFSKESDNPCAEENGTFGTEPTMYHKSE